MGRRFTPRGPSGPVRAWALLARVWALAAFVPAAFALAMLPAQAETASLFSGPAVAASQFSARAPAGTTATPAKPGSAKLGSAKPGSAKPDPAKMIVEANELVQNNDDNTAAASGNVRIYYKGRTLEADRVVYNKTAKRLYAEGHAKLTERDGSIVRGDRFDLSDDFRDGFVDSLRAETPDKTRFSAPRAERTSGATPGDETTVYERGTYTACDVCKGNPSKPPLWQVRAKRIIHKAKEQMVYFEDAYLEFLGIPIAYVPYFSAPDPDVTRKSGVLAPTALYRSSLGYGAGLPVFFNLAPNMDLTLTPTFFTNQGFFGAAEFRQRFVNGMYYIKASGIDEARTSAFANPPYGASNQRARGDIQTQGEFNLNEEWKFGWDVIALSDKYYLRDYSIHSPTTSTNYFSDSISTAYLTGQGARSYFDLRGYYIEGLSAQDIQKQQPVVHPVLDYNRTFDIDPATSSGIGGQFEIDANFTSISAASASFQSVGTQTPTLDSTYGLYNVCNVYTPGKIAGSSSSCLLRGIGGDFNRATAQVTYQRKYIDPLGQVWTPFAFVRANSEEVNLNTVNTLPIYNGNGPGAVPIANSAQSNFVNSGASGYVTPAAGFEYRYPLLMRTNFASIVLEPIAQVIVRPSDQIGSHSMVNIDSQSLVFDNSNLFDWNKYSGYDQFETGTRANYGAQVSMNFDKGGSATFVAGQSAQLAGKNSYATADAANVGLSSGLDTRRSDYVAGATIAPVSFFSFAANSRFDVSTLALRRLDLVTSFKFSSFTGGIQYAHYDQQPLIGYNVTREGLSLNGKYDIAKYYFLKGNVTFDMSRHLYAGNLIDFTNPGLFPVAAMGIGGGYNDGCTSLTINYSSVYQNNGTGLLTRNQTVLVSLELRTLGDSKFMKTSPVSSTLDGVQ